MEKSLEVGDMKEAGKRLWNKSLPVGQRGTLFIQHQNSDLHCHYAPLPDYILLLAPHLHVVPLSSRGEGARLIPNVTRLLMCSDHPESAAARHGQSVPDNPGLVTGSGQGRWRLTLSRWVCSVSGTSFTIHLLLRLFFRLTTPLPLLSFGIFPSCVFPLVNCSACAKYHITVPHMGGVLLIFFFVKEDRSSCSVESSLR